MNAKCLAPCLAYGTMNILAAIIIFTVLFLTLMGPFCQSTPKALVALSLKVCET